MSAIAAFNTRLLAPVDIADVRIARPRASPLGGTKKNAEIGSPSVEKQHNAISALTTDERLATGAPSRAGPDLARRVPLLMGAPFYVDLP
jgi:hypothetical protein